MTISFARASRPTWLIRCAIAAGCALVLSGCVVYPAGGYYGRPHPVYYYGGGYYAQPGWR